MWKLYDGKTSQVVVEEVRFCSLFPDLVSLSILPSPVAVCSSQIDENLVRMKLSPDKRCLALSSRHVDNPYEGVFLIQDLDLKFGFGLCLCLCLCLFVYLFLSAPFFVEWNP
jgi:hypothetical protein